MTHTLTIKSFAGDSSSASGTIRLSRSYTRVSDMPAIPRQGDTIIWDEDMPGQQVQRVEIAYLRGTGMGIIDKRRLYTHVTIWVSR